MSTIRQSKTPVLRVAAMKALEELVREACNKNDVTATIEDRVLDAQKHVREVVPDLVEWPVEKPSAMPDTTWERLTVGQRALTIVRNELRAVLSSTLPTESYLMSAYPNLRRNERARSVVRTMYEASPLFDQNPTLDSVISYVSTQCDQNQPLRFTLSQCIKRPEGYRLQKFLGLTNGNSAGTETFCDGYERHGWVALRQMLSAAGDDASAIIFLGDGDFFTIDQCEQWCTPDQLSKLDGEVKALQNSTQEEADTFFGSGRVQVLRWSDQNIQAFFDEEYQKASNLLPTQVELMETSRGPYTNTWGYGGFAKKYNISLLDLRRYIDDDVFRTAASYRSEASRVRDMKLFCQCWGEKTAKPYWPLEISDFDGSGLPPSLLLDVSLV